MNHKRGRNALETFLGMYVRDLSEISRGDGGGNRGRVTTF